MSTSLQVERQGRTLVLTMNRPDVRNAVDEAMALAIADAVDELDGDEDLAVGVIVGAGLTFCAGMDLRAFLAGGRREVPGRGFAGLTQAPPRKPLVAAVEGFALAGGFEIVLACDLVVAGETSQFGLPEVKRGLIAGSGGLLRLPNRVPTQIAMEYALTGRTMAAPEAYRFGLVNRLTPDGSALAEALKLAAEISANGPLAVLATKRIIVDGGHWSPEQAWGNQTVILEAIIASHDAQEGAAAFIEKRSPVWRSR